MIECIFTIDYELYGNGGGSLTEHVVTPTAALIKLFQERRVPLVCFAEVSEFQRIEQAGSDPEISAVRAQLKCLFELGCEIALHLHPQWTNAIFKRNQWHLDYSEYNLCTLPPERISKIINDGIAYLRDVLNEPTYVPTSFRAGNWLFQPSKAITSVLHQAQVKIDSSVFKGGVQTVHRLDYRPSLRNGPFWTFSEDVNAPTFPGKMMEIPIYTVQTPIWSMLSRKRVALQARSAAAKSPASSNLARAKDYMRFRFPKKFDFCRMTLKELISITKSAIAESKRLADSYIPFVAIGHSKDLHDFDCIRSYLDFLDAHKISVTTLQRALPRCATLLRTCV